MSSEIGRASQGVSQQPAGQSDARGVAPEDGWAHDLGATDVPLSSLTIPALLDEAVSRFAKRTAVLFLEQGVRWTWRRFSEKVDWFAAGLAKLGAAQAGMARDTGHTQPRLAIEIRIDRPAATNRRWRAGRVPVLALKVVVPSPVPGGAALPLRQAELPQGVVQPPKVGLQVPIRRSHVRIVAADHAAGKLDGRLLLLGGQRQPARTHDFLLGRHGQLLRQVSAALGAFDNAMTQLGLADRVAAFTASDFGRTLTFNYGGTDHGWGSHHFLVGGAVNGAAFYGTPPELGIGSTDAPADTGHAGQGRLIPTTSVDQFAATLARWFGAGESQIQEILPNLRYFGAAAGRPDYPSDLGFLRPT